MSAFESLTDFDLESIRAASQRADVVSAVEHVYRELDAEIAARAPTCWNSGACCRFGEYGHRLYVTTLEAAYYLAGRRSQQHASVANPQASLTTCAASLPVLQRGAPSSDVCPHAWGGRCQVRDVRPLGCRIFYCDPAAQDWQGPATEAFLTRLRNLHDQFGVPYIYAEWMQVLERLR